MELSKLGLLIQLPWLLCLVLAMLDPTHRRLRRWTLIIGFVGLLLYAIPQYFEILSQGGIRVNKYHYARGAEAVVYHTIFTGTIALIQFTFQHIVIGPTLQEYERAVVLALVWSGLIAAAHSWWHMGT